jgi:hypothetical protein
MHAAAIWLADLTPAEAEQRVEALAPILVTRPREDAFRGRHPPYDQLKVLFNMLPDYRSLFGLGEPSVEKAIGNWRSDYDFVVVITNDCAVRLDDAAALRGRLETAK